MKLSEMEYYSIMLLSEHDIDAVMNTTYPYVVFDTYFDEVCISVEIQFVNQMQQEKQVVTDWSQLYCFSIDIKTVRDVIKHEFRKQQ